MQVDVQTFLYVFRCFFHKPIFFESTMEKIPLTVFLQVAEGFESQHRLLMTAMYSAFSAGYAAQKSSLAFDVFEFYFIQSLAKLNLSEDQRAQLLNYYRTELQPHMQPSFGPGDAQPEDEYINSLYQHYVAKPSIEIAWQESQVSGQYQKVQDAIQRTEMMTQAHKAPVNPFDKSAADNSEIMSTGIPWLDEILGGGLRRKNSYGLLAGYGGGKTTLTTQLAVSLATVGFKVMVIYTEQSMKEAEMVDKYWSLITGASTDELAKYDTNEDFPEELVNQSHRNMAKAISEKLLVFDRSDGSATMGETTALVKQHKPDVLLFDWIGAFVEHMKAHDEHKDKQETDLIRMVNNDLTLLSREMNMAPVSIHQIAPAEMGSPTKDYDHTMAANCKQFAEKLSGCFIIAPRDTSNHVTRVIVSKSRWSNPGEKLVQLRGAYSKFVEADNYKQTNRGFKKKDDDKMPTTSKTSVAPPASLA